VLVHDHFILYYKLRLFIYLDYCRLVQPSISNLDAKETYPKDRETSKAGAKNGDNNDQQCWKLHFQNVGWRAAVWFGLLKSVFAGYFLVIKKKSAWRGEYGTSIDIEAGLF